jgi:polar amino acid transport system substrate-binding protein
MRVQRGKLAASVLGTVLLVSAGGCGASTATSTDGAPGADATAAEELPQVQPDPNAIKLLPPDLQEGGKITMAADLHYPPTSFLAEDNTTPIGYNVDIAHLLGEALGLEVEVKNVTWDGVIPGIAAHRYDFTATNMSPTPERLEVLDMITYWEAGSSLIVSKGNPLGLSLADQSTCGKKIAVMTGSTQQETYLPEISEACEANGEDAVDAVVLPNVQGALTQLASKRIDGVFSDTSQLAWAEKQQSQAFELLSPQYKKKEGDSIVALGLPNDSPLSPALHAAMQYLIDDGAYQAALDRWGLGAGAIPTSKILS